jgi:hypothetical protein
MDMKLRYNKYSEYIKKKWGHRVQKITVDAGFTCPNRDGTRGVDGCIYCNNESFSPSHRTSLSLKEQIEKGIELSKRRYKTDKYFVYFQSYSNTYAPLDKLKKLYEEALSFKGVIGLAIGTRPDCVDERILDYISSLAKNYDITLELGIESTYNTTLNKINRGHDYQALLKALKMTEERDLDVCAHLILGFPFETKEQWLNMATIISKLPIKYLKLHQLQIIKNTKLQLDFEKEPFSTFNEDEYMDIAIKFLELLNKKIIIQRLIGESSSRFLIAPIWNLTSAAFNEKILKKMEQIDTWQGRLYT